VTEFIDRHLITPQDTVRTGPAVGYAAELISIGSTDDGGLGDVALLFSSSEIEDIKAQTV
jgi:hypothetical protein